MAYVVLQQVSNKYAILNAGKTLNKPVALKYLKKYFEPEKFNQICEGYPNGYVYIWGAKFERHHQIPKMIPGHSLVLFRRGKRVFRVGLIKDLLVNEAIGRKPTDNWQGMTSVEGEKATVAIDLIKQYLNDEKF